MRSKVTQAVAVLLSVIALPLCAAGIDGNPADLEGIQALEARASAAEPREQCFLYAELVHQMTELSVREYSAGDVARATAMLKNIQQLAQKIPRALAANNKHMKDAEILLRHTAFRLNEMLHGMRYEDRPLVEATLTEVSQAQKEALLQVFKK